jgi:anti-sigma B factor antagonist
MALKCEIRQVGDVSILDLKGSLSLEARQAAEPNIQILEKVRGLVEGGNKNLVLNFAGISYMDSAGIGQLIGAITSTRSRGGQIKILKPTGEVRKLLNVTQLSRVVEIHEDEDGVVRSYATANQ